MLIKPSEVKVREGLERFRKDLGNLKELADSIRIYGQIQPIVVNQGMELIAGGRRLAACSLYNMDVEVKVIDENDSLAMREIEVEENVQRQDFSPAEHVLAVKELHELKCKIQDQKTGIPWTMDDTAKILGKDRSSVSKDLDLAAMVTAFPSLEKCKTKKELRSASEALMKLLDRAENISSYECTILASDRVTLSNKDAVEFMQGLESNSVDILLCDPPYGIDISDVAIVAGGETGGENKQGFTYADTQYVAFEVIEMIAKESGRFCKDTAHLYMFCAPEYFHDVVGILTLGGWQPHVRPIIWAKPGGGQSNMPERWPVSSYEMCIYARRENTKLLYARPDVLNYSRVQAKDKIHPTQKPVDMLQDLITRSVHPGAVLVDPCMGSGSAIVAGLKEKLICYGNELLLTAYTAAADFIAGELKEEKPNVKA